MLSQSGTSSSDYSVLLLLLLCITDYISKGLYLKEQLKFIFSLKNFAQKRLRPSEICIFSDGESQISIILTRLLALLDASLCILFAEHLLSPFVSGHLQQLLLRGDCVQE